MNKILCGLFIVTLILILGAYLGWYNNLFSSVSNTKDNIEAQTEANQARQIIQQGAHLVKRRYSSKWLHAKT